MPSKIALSFIYGNCQEHIERFLEAFAPCVDVIYACRAIGDQEPDETREKIERFCQTIGLKRFFLEYRNRTEFPHIDSFGAARDFCWQRAAETSEATHLMWADCDDILQEGAAKAIREACDNATEEVLICPYDVRGGTGKQIVLRERIIKNNGISLWDFAIHESLKFKEECKYRIIKDAVFIHLPDPTRATSAPRNRAILHNEIKDTPRNLFYLGQEAFEAGNIEALKKYGNLALQFPELDHIFRYETLCNLAQVETDGEKAKTLAARAYFEMPDRREALALMSHFHIIDGNNDAAHEVAKAMMNLPFPSKSYWSLNREWYEWKAFYLFTRTLRLVGNHDEADELEDSRFFDAGCKISLIHATRGRPEQAQLCRDMWFSKADKPEQIEHIFCMDDDDKASIAQLKGFRGVSVQAGGGCVRAWNEGAAMSQGKILLQLSDDWIPPQGWDTIILDRMGDLNQPSVLAVSDGMRTDSLLCMAILTRKRYEDQGFMFHPDFRSMYSDNYFTAMAEIDEVLIDAKDVVFVHTHPAFIGGGMDKTYQETNAPIRYMEGKAVFDRLMKEGK